MLRNYPSFIDTQKYDFVGYSREDLDTLVRNCEARLTLINALLRPPVLSSTVSASVSVPELVEDGWEEFLDD